MAFSRASGLFASFSGPRGFFWAFSRLLDVFPALRGFGVSSGLFLRPYTSSNPFILSFFPAFRGFFWFSTEPFVGGASSEPFLGPWASSGPFLGLGASFGPFSGGASSEPFLRPRLFKASECLASLFWASGPFLGLF